MSNSRRPRCPRPYTDLGQVPEADEVQPISPFAAHNEPINGWITAVDRLDEVQSTDIAVTLTQSCPSNFCTTSCLNGT